MIDENYLNSLNNYEVLSKTAIFLSKENYGKKANNFREEYGSWIFGKICLHTIAIQKLLPDSTFFHKINGKKVWDLASICSLSRSLIETYNVFHYLIIEDIDPNELEFRRILWELHSECERLEMLKLIKSKAPEITKIIEDIAQYKSKLINNKFFKGLEHKTQKKFRNGKSGIFKTNSQISENAGINPDYYKAVNKYLSNFVHTYPFAIIQLSLFRAGDKESLERIKTVIDYCKHYLCLAIRDFLKLCPELKIYISNEIFVMIEDAEYIVKFEK